VKRKDSAYSSAGASGEISSASDDSAATLAPIARDFAKIRVARDHLTSPREGKGDGGKATAGSERTVMISARANKEHTSYWRRIKVMALGVHTSQGGKG